MLEHLYFLPLLLLFLLPWLFKKPKYYITISSIVYSGIKKSKNYSKICEYLFCAFLFCAALDFTYTGNFVTYTTPKLSFVLINDASSSMSASRLNDNLVKANEKFLELLDGKDVLVGCIVFSNDAFVSSYLIDDIDLIYDKLGTIEWTTPPLCQGTEVEKAIWAGIRVILKNSDNIKQADINKLRELVSGSGAEFPENVIDLKEMYRVTNGNCLILFTDGYFNIVSQEGLSTAKLVDLCKYLGIKFYIIDMMPMFDMLNQFGFINKVKNTGGNIFVVNDTNIAAAYEEIFKIESTPRNTYVWRKQSFAHYFGILALICMSFSFIFKRNLTSV